MLKHDETFALFDRFGDMQQLGQRRPGPVPRGHALPVAPRAADRRRAPDVPRLDGEGRQQPADRRADEPGPDAAARSSAEGHAAHLPRQVPVAGRVLRTHARHQPRRRHGAAAHVAAASTPTSSTCSRCAACERKRRGERLPTESARDRGACSATAGLDGRARRTRLRFDPAPDALDERQARLRPDAAARARSGTSTAPWSASRATGRARGAGRTTTRPSGATTTHARAAQCACAEIETSNPLVNRWLDRSALRPRAC